MLLEEPVFDQILQSLHATRELLAVVGSAGGGHRRAPRFATNSRLTIFPFAPGSESLGGYDFPVDAAGKLQIPLGQPISVPVRDLSRGGLRFLMPRRVPLDTPFVLMLPNPLRAEPIGVECSVTYWQPIERELFAIGAQFRRQLAAFVIPSTPPVEALPAAAVSPVRQVG